MQIIRDIKSLRKTTKTLCAGNRTLALVPTMGALHDGHMALVRAARTAADVVAVSIFVNPTQFGPNEDFDAYPRTEEADAAMLAAEGVDLIWMPPVAVMYPAGHATLIHVHGLGDLHCGAARPGHFDGVATIVSKLFNQVQPDLAFFGEKDWQQLAIIRRMTADLDMPVDVRGVPIARADDGLALSSRNAYLSPENRARAAAFPAALKAAIAALQDGKPVAQALAEATASIIAGGFDYVDYVALVDADTLVPLDNLSGPMRLMAAARIGKTRLIDNFSVNI